MGDLDGEQLIEHKQHNSEDPLNYEMLPLLCGVVLVLFHQLEDQQIGHDRRTLPTRKPFSSREKNTTLIHGKALASLLFRWSTNRTQTT